MKINEKPKKEEITLENGRRGPRSRNEKKKWKAAGSAFRG